MITRLLLVFFFSLAARAETPLAPQPISAEIRERFGLASFYEKHVVVGGLPIVASARCSDAAVREAAWIIRRMLAGRDDLLAAMAENRVRLAVMASSEYTT